MSRRLLIAGAMALLAVSPARAFEVFNSKTNTAADRAPGTVPNGGGVTNLNIWIDPKEPGVGNSNSGIAAQACAGTDPTGDYACAWEFEFTTTGNIRITGFTPAQGGDYVVMHPTTFGPTTQALRMNGGKPAGPVYELNELLIGTLHVQATGPTGQVLLQSGNSVNNLLNLVPIPNTPKMLAAVCGTGTTDSDCDALQAPGDNCPFFAQTASTDTDTDLRGNECECGDVNQDGRNTVADLVGINGCIFAPNPKPPNCVNFCDANNDGLCNVADMIASNQEIFSPTNTSTCARQPVPGP
jgi:hypothetical protein